MITKKLVTDYKSKTASRYLSVNDQDIAQRILKEDSYYASIKYDGHFGMVAVKDNTAVIYNRSGEEISIPKLQAEAVKLAGGKSLVLAGEIVCFQDDKPGRHSLVASAIAKPDNFDIRFGIYDIISTEDNPVTNIVHEKLELIKQLATGGKEIFSIEQIRFESRKDIVTFYQQHVPQHEGVVVRSMSGFIYKIKPQITLDLVVLGYAEGVSDRAGMLRDLLLGYITPEGTYNIVAKCGGGFSEETRTDLLKQLAPMQVASEYTEISSAKTAFVMIEPTLVAEISCLDMLNENSSGPIQKMSLKYDPATGYSNAGTVNCVTCISPNFIRLRTDKKAVAEDAGEKQITDHKDIISDEAAKQEMQDSSIVRKEIYIKKAKDATAVRKMTIVKTNKEQTEMYAPYFVMYTDFSAGRKSPLDQDIYLCLTEAEANEKVEELKAENIKKGWEQVN